MSEKISAWILEKSYDGRPIISQCQVRKGAKKGDYIRATTTKESFFGATTIMGTWLATIFPSYRETAEAAVKDLDDSLRKLEVFIGRLRQERLDLIEEMERYKKEAQ